MLGEQIGEIHGAVTSVRVVSADPALNLEIMFQGGGTILGNQVADIVTYRNHMRPDGAFNGSADGMVFTTDAQGATYTGHGLGRMLGRGGAAQWRGSLVFQTP